MVFVNKQDYLEKRQQMMEEAQKSINKKDAAAADKIMKQVEKMDKEWEEYAQKMANWRASHEDPQGMPPFRMNETMGGDADYIETSDNPILNRGDKLYNNVLYRGNEETAKLTERGAFGNIIKGMVTGDWSHGALKNVVTTTATGTLIPQILSSKIIDMARDKSLFSLAGVPVVSMSSDNVTIARVKNDPQFKFKKENEAADESDFEMDGVTLKSKTCYGYVYVSLETIKSSVNLEDILLPVFAKAIAQAMDNGMLYGQYNSVTVSYDDFAPAGIMNDKNINVLEATEGNGYDDFIKAFGKIKAANGEPKVVGINSNTEELLSLLKTTEGQYLLPPKAFDCVEKIVSNQLAYSEEKGSDALVFDPAAMVIGIQNNITVKMIEDGECLKKGLVGFQIYAMLDCKTTVPKHICKITGIK